jgi:hypothetical protein
MRHGAKSASGRRSPQRMQMPPQRMQMPPQRMQRDNADSGGRYLQPPRLLSSGQAVTSLGGLRSSGEDGQARFTASAERQP